jgi:putative endopeptidase
MKFQNILAVSLACVYISCNNHKENMNNTKGQGLDLANFDTTANPKNDFYQFVNGNWTKNNPIPSTESRWGSFNELDEKKLTNLKQILEEASAEKAEQGSNKQKIGDFYSTGMDSVKLQQDGVTPLNEEFAGIASIKNNQDLVKLIAHHHLIGIGSLFSFSVAQDEKISTQNISYIGQGGIGLPDRDYYLGDDATSKNFRAEYLKYIQKMFELMGEKPEAAAKNAGTIMNIETSLAKASMTQVQLRDIEAQYNKMTLEQIKKLYPSIDWDTYLTSLGVGDIKEVIVSQPDFFKEVNDLFKKVPIDDWKTYLKWQLINGTAGKLSDSFVMERFHFYGTVVNGIKEIKPRWKRCLDNVDAMMGEALGQLYVEKHFSPESKKRVNEMVDNLIAAYKERINTRDWMSPETKKQATAKLDKIMKKLAYPDKWRDYSALEIKRDSYVQNFIRANEFESRRNIKKLHEPVDRTEWGMSPQTINAYYNPSMNEIVFPAGIMQPPFFNADADDAVNYGSMGAIIGHELTHGFDDQGCQFDADGNLKNWWTDEDKAKFKAKTEMVVKQFNGYFPLDSIHINGELTLGENIADLGGLTIAYAGYKKSLEGKPHPENLDGFTAEQRFFLAWAQGWRSSYTKEALEQQIKTNPHSPGKYRVLGPLANLSDFHESFGLKEGDAMYRPQNERAEIW